MATNPCAKTVKPEQAYEVYQSEDGEWTYYVLKKYQTEEKELKNPFARWYCATSSPYTHGSLEYGDGYAAQIKANALKLRCNPLVLSTVQEAPKTLIVQTVTDEVREHFTVTDLTPRARKHKQYQIALPNGCVHTISKQRSIVGPIEFYDCQDGRVIVTDHAWNQVNASLKKQEVS